MVSISRDIRALGRGIWARFLRSNVATFLLPVGIGAIFTAIAFSWTYDNVSSMRNQAKKDIHLSLRLAESRVNSTIAAEFDRLEFAALNANARAVKSGSPNIQVWQFNPKTKKLVLKGQPSTQISLAQHQSADHPVVNLSSQEFIAKIWQNYQDARITNETQHENFMLFDHQRTLGFTLPILSVNGQLSGIAFSSIPVSQITNDLPPGTYFVDTLSSSYIGSKSAFLTDFAKERLLNGEVVPNELYSSARKINRKLENSDWRVWSDHPISELWSQVSVRRSLNYPGLLLAGVWIIVTIAVRSLGRVKNRQRQLIGSLVGRIVWITHPDGSIDYVLGKITSQLGWKEVDYADVSIGLFAHPEDREKLMDAISKCNLLCDGEQTLEIRFENKDKEYRWYEVALSNMIDVPEINGIVITTHDIELRKHATDHILASKKAAEKANEAKSEFLSRMSHELRTPLNAILGFGQLLEMEAISDRQAENIGQILIAGRHLLNLVNDILDIARIETRKVNLSVEQVNVRAVIEESFALLGPLAAKNHVTLSLEEADCPLVWSDQQRLKQVVLNLVSNGIKYNVDGGAVHVRMHTAGDSLKVEVSDTGIGIESQYLERVFTPFDRLGSDNSQVEGSGLGLALSKTLVEAMGATLDVRSEYGQGSTFTITFKESSIVKSEVADQDEDSDNTILLEFGSPDDFRILLIEDNVVNLRYVTKVVEKMSGVFLMSAKEGGIGVEMARTQYPDLILLDLDLPDLHGTDVLAALRHDPATANTRIVVMSAETNPHVVENLLSLGADKFVTKPVDVNSLVSLFSAEKNVA